MAEKIQCKTCGYMLDPDAQFCPMCFAPTNVGPQPAPQPQPTPGPQPGLDRGYNYGPGPQPAQGGNGKIIGLIIGLAAEVLITVGVVVLVLLSKKQLDAKWYADEADWQKQKQEAEDNREIIPMWTQNFTDFINEVAPGRDVSKEAGIDNFNETDYMNNPDYITFDNSIGPDFGGLVPRNMFCYASENENAYIPLDYGTIQFQENFVGDDKSILKYEYITGNGTLNNDETANSIINSEMSRLDMTMEKTQCVTQLDGTVNVLLYGIDNDTTTTKLATTELFKINGNQIYKMTYSYPGSKSTGESNNKKAVADTLIKNCLFSGEVQQ